MRQLFAIILVFCQPQNPDGPELFERHLEDLCEDFVRIHGKETGRDYCLVAIQEHLRLHQKSLADFGLPNPCRVSVDKRAASSGLQLGRGINSYKMLNQEQRVVVDNVLGACHSMVSEGDVIRIEPSSSDHLFFLDGPAGSGKTFIYSTLIDLLSGQGKVVFPVALTGIATTLLPGGRTLHSRFKLPIPLNETSTSAIKPGDYNAEQLKSCDLIIWDEAPMAPGMTLQVIDRLMRDITRKHEPFGGKTFLLAGDFRQCLPIVPKGARAAITSASIQRSKHWPNFQKLQLLSNMRADPSEKEFADWLIKLGNGCLPSSEAFGDDSFEIPGECVAIEPLEDILYGDKLSPMSCASYAQIAILTPCNEASFEVNDKILSKIEGESRTYKSVDCVECETDEEARNYPMEFINNMTPTGMPQHELSLKIGAPIMLLRNLNPGVGLCNGTRMIVSSLHDHLIGARRITGESDTVFIPRIDCLPSEGDLSVPFKLKRRQFPIRVAFCMTITKAQGQTFDKVGLFLPSPAFGHGQVYVAFSRVRRFQDIRVSLGDHPNQGENEGKWWTQNIVYKEVL